MSEDGNDISTAVLIFAHYLGIDIETEPDLLSIAEEGLQQLPKGWELGIGEGDNAGIPFFYNEKTGQSVWKHPEENVYISKIQRQRQLRKEKVVAKPVNNNSKGRNSNSSEVKVKSPSNTNKTTKASSNHNNYNESDFEDEHEHATKASNNATSATSSNNAPGFGMQVSDFLVEDFADVESDADTFWNKKKETNKVLNNPSNMTTSNDDVSKSSTVVANKHTFEEKRVEFSDDTSKTSSRRDKEQSNTGNNTKWSSSSLATDNDTKETLKSSHVTNNKSSYSSIDNENTNSRVDRNKERPREREKERENDEDYNNSIARSFGFNSIPAAASSSSNTNSKDIINRNNNNNNNPSPSRPQVSNDLKVRSPESKTTISNKKINNYESENEDLSSHTRNSSKFYQQHNSEPSNSSGNGNDWDKRREDSKVAELASSLESSNKKYQYEIQVLEDRVKELRKRLDDEVSNARESNKRLEERVNEEKEERRGVEEKLTRVQFDCDARLRDYELAAEVRTRDAVKKARNDCEDDSKERLRIQERRYNEELTIAKDDLMAAKRKAEELLRDVDDTRRKVTLSKEEGKLEIQVEFEHSKQALSDAEHKIKAQTLEMKKLREDHISIAGRLGSALQIAQISNAEAEAAKATTSSAVTESQTNHAALVQATQRIQQIDSEAARYRAEAVLLRRENETLQAELRKLMSTSHTSGDKIGIAESEARRIKAQAQAEISRLSSRVIELETIQSVLRSELDKSSELESQSSRDFKRQIDRAEFECTRLRERLTDMEIKSQSDSVRITTLERENLTLQEEIFKKERISREERRRAEAVNSGVKEIRENFDLEISNLQKENSDLIHRHKIEIDEIKKDVSEKLPKIAAVAIENLEQQIAFKFQQQLVSVKSRYDVLLGNNKKELQELQALQAERDARLRASTADERAELESVKYQLQRLKRKNDELESEIDKHRRELKYLTYYDDTPSKNSTNQRNTSRAGHHNHNQQQRPARANVNVNAWRESLDESLLDKADKENGASMDESKGEAGEVFLPAATPAPVSGSVPRPVPMQQQQQQLINRANNNNNNNSVSMHTDEFSAFQQGMILQMELDSMRKQLQQSNTRMHEEEEISSSSYISKSSKILHYMPPPDPGPGPGSPEGKKTLRFHPSVAEGTGIGNEYSYRYRDRDSNNASRYMDDDFGIDSTSSNSIYMHEHGRRRADYTDSYVDGRDDYNGGVHNRSKSNSTSASTSTSIAASGIDDNRSDEADFEGIQDGGYYEGYWKTKYSSRR